MCERINEINHIGTNINQIVGESCCEKPFMGLMYFTGNYVEHLDNILTTTGENVLIGARKVSHAQAMNKAKQKYQKYISQKLSPVEEAYLETIKSVEKEAKKNT